MYKEIVAKTLYNYYDITTTFLTKHIIQSEGMQLANDVSNLIMGLISSNAIVNTGQAHVTRLDYLTLPLVVEF